MAVIDMERTDADRLNPNTGAIFHNTVEISAGSVSDEYVLPVLEVYAIAVKITGDGDLEFTNDPRSVIDLGNAEYVAWNGTDLINPAVTAFRVTRNTGTVTAKVTLRTAEA